MFEPNTPFIPRGSPLQSMESSASSSLDGTEIRRSESGQDGHRASPDQQSFELESWQASSYDGSSIYGEGRDDDGLEVVDSSHTTKKNDRNSPTSWVPELLCFCTAFVSLAAIFSLLSVFNNRQQPQWPYASTLNLGALVALLATITRSMIGQVLESVLGQLKWRWFRSSARPLYHLKLYDEASHGTWGSIQFIFSLFNFNLATTAAATTALTLGIGIFAQQSLHTTPCLKRLANENASMPIAQTSLTALVEVGDLAVELKAAFLSGLSSSQAESRLFPACNSGNCTFPKVKGSHYTTVGFGSACVDASSMLMQTGPLSWDPSDNPLDPAERSVNYSLSSGLSLTYHLWPSSLIAFRNHARWETMLAMSEITGFEDENLMQQALNRSPLNNLSTSYYGTQSFKAIGILIPTKSPCQNFETYQGYFDHDEDLAMPPVNPNSCPQLKTPNITSFPGFFAVTAAVCFFYPSLSQLQGSITNGQVSESVLSGANPLQPNPGDYNPYSFSQDPQALVGISDPCIVEDVLYTGSNYSDAPGGHFNISGLPAPRRCTYGFEWGTVYDMQASLLRILTGTDSSAVKSDCRPYSSYRAMMCTGAWWLSGIYNGGYASVESIQAYMDRAFKSFNDQLRMQGTDWDGDPSNISGMEYTTEVCVQFRPAWLIFPLCLVVGTFALLVAMVISGFTRGQKEIIWKSSVTPHLFYGVQDQNTHETSELPRATELEKAARQMKADFSISGRGWGFRVIDSKDRL